MIVFFARAVTFLLRFHNPVNELFGRYSDYIPCIGITVQNRNVTFYRALLFVPDIHLR